MEHIVLGLLAHVDAGKTTLAEALLYAAGAIPAPGRVDHRDAFLDRHALERARGITIFANQARFSAHGLDVSLLDTPGHADFSAEAERTLQVLDYAVLVISATDGVQAHTETLWRLLRRRQIPTFLFVNKMDLPTAGRARLLAALRRAFGEGVIDCTDRSGPDWAEQVALRDERVLERYLAAGRLDPRDVSGLVRVGAVFPCFFGAALRLDGVEELLAGLAELTEPPVYGPELAARVFKIDRDPQGVRQTHVKVTGGALRVRAPLTYLPEGSEEPVTEKVTQLRLWSGERYEAVDEVPAGQVAAVLGLSRTWAGQGLGAEEAAPPPLLEPVLTYRLLLPPDVDPRTFLPKLRQLEEEDPQLHIVWDERHQELHARLMVPIQIEVLKSLVAERFDVDLDVDAGRILYKETIAAPVEGVGHFEPLRHYAEVHLLLSPLPEGSGLRFSTRCSEDQLDRSWQRLILAHLRERTHRGVLTGAPITDMELCLMSGRAHAKHTEGGDFRQATYRAVRQGLMRAQSVLLEPWYAFTLDLPAEQLGRAIGDLQAMSARFSAPTQEDGRAVLTGTAPVAAMKDHPLAVAAYSRGRGRISLSLHGYAPCHEQEKVVAASGYDPLRDPEHTPDSVFCAHGAGHTVRWDEVEAHMHLESCLAPERPADDGPQRARRAPVRSQDWDERELEEIFERTFGKRAYREYQFSHTQQTAPLRPIAPPKQRYVIVDGSNMIFAWDELRALAREDLDAARQRLMDLLSDYATLRGCRLVLVFDGYKVKGNRGTQSDYHGIEVVYTREDETGDLFIEKLLTEVRRSYAVRVATSDELIQLAALRAGVLRMSARELEEEVQRAQVDIADAVRRWNESEQKRR